MVPPTIAAAFEILRAIGARNDAGALSLATRAGRSRLEKILASPTDPRLAVLRSWKGSARGRIAGARAMCSFAAIDGGRVAVLALESEAGRWRLDDVAIVDEPTFEGFGDVDDPNRVIYSPKP
jgi:hypothetical protein